MAHPHGHRHNPSQALHRLNQLLGQIDAGHLDDVPPQPADEDVLDQLADLASTTFVYIEAWLTAAYLNGTGCYAVPAVQLPAAGTAPRTRQPPPALAQRTALAPPPSAMAARKPATAARTAVLRPHGLSEFVLPDQNEAVSPAVPTANTTPP